MHKESLDRLFKSRLADILVCAGDLSVFGNGLQKSINSAHGKTILIIPGNHESEEEVKILPKAFALFHYKESMFWRLRFVGFGEGGFPARARHGSF